MLEILSHDYLDKSRLAWYFPREGICPRLDLCVQSARFYERRETMGLPSVKVIAAKTAVLAVLLPIPGRTRPSCTTTAR